MTALPAKRCQHFLLKGLLKGGQHFLLKGSLHFLLKGGLLKGGQHFLLKGVQYTDIILEWLPFEAFPSVLGGSETAAAYHLFTKKALSQCHW